MAPMLIHEPLGYQNKVQILFNDLTFQSTYFTTPGSLQNAISHPSLDNPIPSLGIDRFLGGGNCSVTPINSTAVISLSRSPLYYAAPAYYADFRSLCEVSGAKPQKTPSQLSIN